ncbi:small ribosomal subunit protein uS11m isoform X1 [Microcebus murinus]|uniref:small ribosomal subunit protein uS11m isoform X1 n=1 Tax=Microcebus murinus TaxID=30608 RepID=UPI003F6CD0A2
MPMSHSGPSGRQAVALSELCLHAGSWLGRRPGPSTLARQSCKTRWPSRKLRRRLQLRATAPSERVDCRPAVPNPHQVPKPHQFPSSHRSLLGTGLHSRSIYPPVPGEESSLRWAGKKFEEIPIAHIKATYNNTQIQVVSAANQSLARTSCGTEGFRNAKKGTGIAAQTAGIAAAAKATAKGVTYVRVVVKGLGPGRLSAIKGLTMGGLEVISITDNTPIPHNGCRPRKARRL